MKSRGTGSGTGSGTGRLQRPGPGRPALSLTPTQGAGDGWWDPVRPGSCRQRPRLTLHLPHHPGKETAYASLARHRLAVHLLAPVPVPVPMPVVVASRLGLRLGYHQQTTNNNNNDSRQKRAGQGKSPQQQAGLGWAGLGRTDREEARPSCPAAPQFACLELERRGESTRSLTPGWGEGRDRPRIAAPCSLCTRSSSERERLGRPRRFTARERARRERRRGEVSRQATPSLPPSLSLSPQPHRSFS